MFKSSDVNREMISRGAIDAKHLEWSGCTAVFKEAMDLEALGVGIITENLLQSGRVTMKVGNDGLIGGKKCLKLARAELAIGRTDGFVR